MLCGVGDEDVVEYQLARPVIQRWVTWFVAAWIVLGIAVTVGQWFAHHRLPVYPVGCIVIGTAWLIWWRSSSGRTRTVSADTEAIHLARALRDIPWRDVDHVQAPTRWSDVVRVVMDDGTEKPTGFPPEYAERLASVGNKPLQ